MPSDFMFCPRCHKLFSVYWRCIISFWIQHFRHIFLMQLLLIWLPFFLPTSLYGVQITALLSDQVSVSPLSGSISGSCTSQCWVNSLYSIYFSHGFLTIWKQSVFILSLEFHVGKHFFTDTKPSGTRFFQVNYWYILICIKINTDGGVFFLSLRELLSLLRNK